MKQDCYTEEIRRTIRERSQEIVDEAMLEIWRRPSLSYVRMAAEWELRAWLLGILSRFGQSEELGLFHFSRPFLWHEAFVILPILLHTTCKAIQATSDTSADLRRYLNLYQIWLGEFCDGGWGKCPTRAIYALPKASKAIETRD